MNTHARFVEAIATFGIGGITILLDFFKYGTVVLGFFGAILAIAGGWEAFKAKRGERQVHELEIQIRRRELERLENGLHRAGESLSDHP